MAYEFFYWPEIQGRGEFVRLALEDAGADYIDVARGLESEGHGVPAMLAQMRGEGTSHVPFAPPFLRDGNLFVSHTAAILLYLGGRIGLAPTDEDGRLWTHQIQLTITDIVQAVYNLHHPIDEDKWFHEQKDEAIARATVFRRDWMPKFLGFLDPHRDVAPMRNPGHRKLADVFRVDLVKWAVAPCVGSPMVLRPIIGVFSAGIGRQGNRYCAQHPNQHGACRQTHFAHCCSSPREHSPTVLHEQDGLAQARAEHSTIRSTSVNDLVARLAAPGTTRLRLAVALGKAWESQRRSRKRQRRKRMPSRH
jgi:glutathione S-transferase